MKDKRKTEPLIYGFALMTYTQSNTIEGQSATIFDTLKDQVGDVVVDHFFDMGTQLLGTVIPFADSAMKILRMLFNQGGSSKED